MQTEKRALTIINSAGTFTLTFGLQNLPFLKNSVTPEGEEQDGRVEGCELTPLMKTTKSQLTAEQPSTKTLQPTKKDILHPKTKKR